MTEIKDFDECMNEIDITEKFENENSFTEHLLEPQILQIIRKKFNVELKDPIFLDSFGNYEFDISGDNRKTIIENQLGKSDHRHHGAVEIYASESNSKDILWFAQEFRSEHINHFTKLNDLYDGTRKFHLATPKIYEINGIEYIQFVKVVDPINLNDETEDDESNIGRQGKAKNPIDGFIYNGIETKTYIYKDALKLICDDLASKHIDFAEKVKEKKYFNESTTTLSIRPYKIKNTNLYVKTNLNTTKDMEKQIREILSLFGYSQDILQFNYRNVQE